MWIFLAALWNWHLKNQEFNQVITNFLQQETPQENMYIISQVPLLNRHPLRNLRFAHLDIETRAKRNNDYLSTNQYLKTLAENRNITYYLELDTLNIFKQAPLYKEQLIYYDGDHLNETGVKEYAIQALSIIKEALF